MEVDNSLSASSDGDQEMTVQDDASVPQISL